jgi:hypothetical protein
MNQARIVQAVGIAILCLLLGGLIVGIILSFTGATAITNQVILTYFLPIVVISQFIVGYWLGRKVGGRKLSLLGHVYFTNIVLSLVNVIVGVILSQNAFWLAAYTPVIAVLLTIPSYPVALLARRK